MREEEEGGRDGGSSRRDGNLLAPKTDFYARLMKKTSKQQQMNTTLTIIGEVASVLKDHNCRKFWQSQWLLKTQKIQKIQNQAP